MHMQHAKGKNQGTRTISGRIPRDLHERVAKLAVKRDRSFNYLLKEALALLIKSKGREA